MELYIWLHFSVITLDLFDIFGTITGAFGCRKTISGKYIFSAVWLSRKSFSRKSIPVFGSSKHFTEIVLRKINSSVWFVQKFYGKYLTEIVLRKINSNVWFVQKIYGKYLTEIVLRKIISGVWFVDQFYRKYEMCYKLKHLYYLHNPVNKVQN